MRATRSRRIGGDAPQPAAQVNWPAGPSSSSGRRAAARSAAAGWPALGGALQAAEVDIGGSFLQAFFNHLLEIGEELAGHITDVLVAADDIVEEELGLCLIVGGLLASELLGEAAETPN